MFFVLKKYHSSPVGVAIDHPPFHLSPIRENLTKKTPHFCLLFHAVNILEVGMETHSSILAWRIP